MDAEKRIKDLERRVEALEKAARGSELTGLGISPDQDALWALSTLKSYGNPNGTVLMAGHVKLPDGGEAQWQEGAEAGDLLDSDWSPSAEVFAALGHRVRLTLLHTILTGTNTTHELLQTEGVGTSGQVYHHLRNLTAAGWLRALGSGRYEIPAERIIPLLVLMMGVRA